MAKDLLEVEINPAEVENSALNWSIKKDILNISIMKGLKIQNHEPSF